MGAVSDTSDAATPSPIRSQRRARRRGSFSRPGGISLEDLILRTWEDLVDEGTPGAPSAAGGCGRRAALRVAAARTQLTALWR